VIIAAIIPFIFIKLLFIFLVFEPRWQQPNGAQDVLEHEHLYSHPSTVDWVIHNADTVVTVVGVLSPAR
jgi:hypothetical protein